MSKKELERWLQNHPNVEFVGVDKDGEIILIKYKEGLL